jgi:hypothetical protein
MVVNVIKISDKFTSHNNNSLFLGTRCTGTELGKEIYKKLNSGEKVIIDFEGVDSVTQSFIDEILGVNFRFLGADIIKKMSFKSCNEEIKKTIKFVYAYSKEMATQMHA